MAATTKKIKNGQAVKRKSIGKQKGASFEREICKQLSILVTGGERDDVFWRSAMSGGRATVRSKKGQETAHASGDICAVHELGYDFIQRYYVECKHYRNLDLPQLMLKASGITYDFWIKAKQEARRYKKKPLLIARQNLYPVLIGMPVDCFGEFFPIRPRGIHHVVMRRLDLVIMTFEEFLEHAQV